MNTKEQIKAELDNLDDAALEEVYRLIKRLERVHEVKSQQTAPKSSGLCGIWTDDRSADEIIADIVGTRSPGRDVAL